MRPDSSSSIGSPGSRTGQSFHTECDQYLAELDNEEEIDKYTLAQLDEEEHSLDRLRRWFL